MTVKRSGLRSLVLVAVVVMLGATLASLYLFSPRAEEQPRGDRPLALPTERVHYRTVSIPVHSRGVARPVRHIPLVTEVGGRVIEVAGDFRDGAFVDPDTVLVQLDPEPFTLDIDRSRNELRAAELHLAKTRANATVARANNKHSSAFARFEPQMAEARSRVEAARAGLRSAERRLEQAQLRAPFAGRLDEVAVQAGQYVQAGTRVAMLSSSRRMEVRLPVRDDWLGLLGFSLRTGAEPPDIEVTLTGTFAGQKGRWQGRVVRREGGVNENRMVFLVVRVDNPPDSGLPLEAGVFVEASLKGPAREQVAVLPRTVLAGEDAVWVMDEQQRLRRRNVRILHRDGDHLYIGGGLPERAEVVRAGGLRLLEGTRIHPLGPAANTAWSAPGVGESYRDRQY